MNEKCSILKAKVKTETFITSTFQLEKVFGIILAMSIIENYIKEKRQRRQRVKAQILVQRESLLLPLYC
jgi:hypothetical protein